MSELRYNGVEFAYCVSKAPHWEPVYEGPDWTCTRVVLTVEGLVFAGWDILGNGARPRGQFGNDPPAAEAFREITHLLEQPRKELLYKVSDVEVVKSGPDLDVRYGPFPKIIGVPRVVGDQGIWITFQVETFILQCPDRTNPHRYTSNRWTETETTGPDWLRTKTRNGKIVLKPGLQPDSDILRYVVTPPIPKGWIRTRAEYQVAEDGLAVSYSVDDKEEYLLPPVPAIKADGDFDEIHTKWGAMIYGVSTKTLTGAPGTPKRKLVLLGLSMCYSELVRAGLTFFTDSSTGAKRTAVDMTIKSKTFANTVSVMMRGRLSPYKANTQRGGQLVLPSQKLNLRHFDVKQWNFLSPDMPLRSLSGLRLLAAKMNDPCLGKTLQRTTAAEMMPDEGELLRT